MGEKIDLNDLDSGCGQCAEDAGLDFDFSMAFQPIVRLSSREVHAYEALVRGLDGASAYSVISRVDERSRYQFDQLCRVKAIALAAQLNVDCVLNINFLPNAVYQPERCIRTTLKAARRYDFPIEKIMFEFTESERVIDNGHLKNIVDFYKRQGLQTAIDDFGDGYAGLGLLADFQTDIVKLDMGLIRGVDGDRARQSIIKGCLLMLRELNIECLAEGVETREEMRCLRDLGIDLMQGFYFAKPEFEALPAVPFEDLLI